MNFLNDQFGRMLFAIAIVWTSLSVFVWNPAQTLPEISNEIIHRPVHVKLDKAALAAASAEVFFPPGPGTQYMVVGHFVFVAPRKIIEFVPVKLDIPPSGTMQPPQILPEGGPSLEGAHLLPRYGGEFPPLELTPKTDPKAPTK